MGLVHLAVILGCATLALGQFFEVPCLETQIVKDFNSNKFTGLWYEITGYSSLECPTIRITRLANNKFEVKSTLCNADKPIMVMGSAELKDNIGQFNITYPSVSNKKVQYRLWATDYTSYSVLGYCLGNYSIAVSVLARSSKLSAMQNKTVNEKLKSISNDINLDKFDFTKQDNCCYDPNSAASIGFSAALLMFTVIVRLL